MAAPRTYPDTTRAAIHQLVNEEGRPATTIAPLLRARGIEQIPPIETIRHIARQTRGDITDRPKAEQLHTLIAGLVRVTDAEISRIDGENEPADADQLLKLARTIREIEPLLTDTPKGKSGDKPASLLGGLQDAATTQSTTKQEPHAALRSLSA